MSDNNYLDELDSLLDDPNSTLMQIDEDEDGNRTVSSPTSAAVTSAATSSVLNQTTSPSQTWAQVIESASQALQESSQLSQAAVQKNIELAKSQQESIKELIDAAGGWRHATRQAVQEVNSAKKNVIMLTIISGIIAIAGFGTTIGVMMQSKASYISMSNLILENVDEHQSLVSKTLTLKMDELASTIEQTQATLEQYLKREAQASTKDTNALPTDTQVSQSDNTSTNSTEQPNTETAANSTPADNSAQSTTPDTTATQTAQTSTPDRQSPVANSTSPEWQVLTQQVSELKTTLQTLNQQLDQYKETQNTQWQTLTTQLDSKLNQTITQLTALNTETHATAHNSTNDQKPVLDQLARLRQEINEMRSLQRALIEQVKTLKQGMQEKSDNSYRYRLPQDRDTYAQ